MKKPFFLIYRIAHPFLAWLRQTPLFLRLLFGIRKLPGTSLHFDTTTILFRKALANEVKAGDTVLEMGIGQAALLSLFLVKRKKVKMSGVDISLKSVKSSVETAKANSLDAQFWQSDLFSNVENLFDVIFFNPPYVSREAGQTLELSRRLNLENELAWNGGEDGTDVLRRFIQQAGKHLKSQGKLMIGVQDFYVSQSQIESIASEENYRLKKVTTGFLNPSRIYTLQFENTNR